MENHWCRWHGCGSTDTPIIVTEKGGSRGRFCSWLHVLMYVTKMKLPTAARHAFVDWLKEQETAP